MEYQDLKFLSKRTCLSVFKLREFIKMGLPHFRVGRKILVNPKEYDEWFKKHHRAVPKYENHNVDQIASQILSEFDIQH